MGGVPTAIVPAAHASLDGSKRERGFQRRPYGLRDEEYLRLKVLTCMLPAL